ncbi:Protein of unknown function [Micromonospora lupini str. Lupac 08]|uniref:Uncharacterized protein n=1 Tax=Micromonospora lupini str. Lupac 08 TaxID=1150864 RepID=I0L7U5_9ACTN|nr:Protein of unknown function [Micromonospora lupini str. Lupac 08]
MADAGDVAGADGAGRTGVAGAGDTAGVGGTGWAGVEGGDGAQGDAGAGGSPATGRIAAMVARDSVGPVNAPELSVNVPEVDVDDPTSGRFGPGLASPR